MDIFSPYQKKTHLTSSLDYDGFRCYVKSYLTKFEEWRTKNSCQENWYLENHCKEIKKKCIKKGFEKAKKNLSFRLPLSRVFADIFLSSRLGKNHIQYLLFQELGKDEFTNNDLDIINEIYSKFFLNIGKSKHLNVYLKVKRIKSLFFKINIDPFPDIREIYKYSVIENVSYINYYFIRYLKLKVLLKSLVIILVSKIYIFTIKKSIDKKDNNRLKKNAKDITRILIGFIINETSKKISCDSNKIDYEYIVEELSDFFIYYIGKISLAQKDSIEPELGVSKILKVAFGVIIGRLDAIPNKPINISDYIIDSIKIGFYWASTYPLVDDILDSPIKDKDKQYSVIMAVKNFINNEKADSKVETHESIVLSEFLQNMKHLIDETSIERIQGWLKLLLEAHVRDSDRKFNHKNYTFTDVIIESTLKAALVRISTREICGILIPEEDLKNFIMAGLHNQMKDDFRDMSEDLNAGCVTAFTLYSYKTNNTTENPYAYTADYIAYLSQQVNSECF